MAIIACEGLTKRYGAVDALRGVGFEVEAGGCIGFLGPNGAGKTTTIRILTGLARPTGGKAAVAGFDVSRSGPEVRRRIGYLAQHPAFYNYMSGQEFLTWTAGLFGLSGQAARSRVEEMLRLTGLWEARKRAIGGYSGGMKQRLGLAQALINRPELVFLDEPVSALDPVGRHEVLTLLDQLKEQTTVFMSSHVLADVERVADQVIIVHEGRIAVQAGIEDLREQYASPAFEVETSSSSPDLMAPLQALPYVAGVSREGTLYRVAARDAALARERLPRDVLDSGATLLRYGVVAPTLEDIFLKVVGQA